MEGTRTSTYKPDFKGHSNLALTLFLVTTPLITASGMVQDR